MPSTLSQFGYSHANLKEDEELTIEQLLNVLLIPSANDAAIVLAEHVSGSVEEFCTLMNNKAKELGCKNTNFVNPNGIQNKDHYSTAYDLALIGQYAMKFPDIMRIAMVTQYTLPTTNKYNKTNRIFNATNALINNESLNKNYYKYATGLKTGFTDESGYCIVSTAKKDDMELIAVILKSNSINERYSDCKTLFNYGFDNYSYTTIHHSNDIIDHIQIGNGTSETRNLDVAIKDDIQVLLKKDIDISDLEPTIEINQDLRAPLAENTVIGKITYTIDGEEISSDLIAANSVFLSSFEVIVFRVLLLFLILYLIYRLLKHNSKAKPDNSNTYILKRGKKRSVKKSKRNLFKSEIDKRPNPSHKGIGKFKFTQINDYL